jgi:Sulfotransferase family
MRQQRMENRRMTQRPSSRSAYEGEIQSNSAARPTAPDVLIHLHIAKTGGTSLSSMIKHGFRSDEIFESSQHVGTPGNMRQAPQEDCERKLIAFGLNDVQYVSGHVPLGVHRIFRRPTKYVTVVRDPIQRIISFFFFQAEDKNCYLKDGRPLTFEEYIEGRADVQLYDYQVRVLCGSPELDVESPGRDQIRPRLHVQRHHLDLAKKNIEELFLAAAPIEEITELGLLVRLVYGWPMRRLQTEYKNSTKSRPHLAEIPIRLIRIMEECNSHDLELYEWVSKRFAEQRKLFEPELSRDRRIYGLVNGVLTTVGEILPWSLRKRLAQTLFYAR